MNAQLRPQSGQIILNEPGETYYRRVLDEASNSGLAVIDEQSPRHYHHWCTHPEETEEESVALAFGKALHCATLEPEVFQATYAVLPADAPRDLRRFRNAAKPSAETLKAIDWWDEWEVRNAGRSIVSQVSHDRAMAMATSVRSLELSFKNSGADIRITVAELIDVCETEVTLRWTDEETGIQCKARADLWSQDLALAMDLKSTRDASREAFARSVHGYRYHVQHCHYADGFRVCGHPLQSFLFLPVETAMPHVPAVYYIDPHAEERGWAIRQRSMRKLQDCLKSGRWPGYTDTVTSLSLPAYAFYDTKD